MTQNYLATEFPDDLPAIQRLRSEHPVFDEICGDLELLGRDIGRFSDVEKTLEQGLYLDCLESARALRREISEILQSQDNSGAD